MIIFTKYIYYISAFVFGRILKKLDEIFKDQIMLIKLSFINLIYLKFYAERSFIALKHEFVRFILDFFFTLKIGS